MQISISQSLMEQMIEIVGQEAAIQLANKAKDIAKKQQTLESLESVLEEIRSNYGDKGRELFSAVYEHILISQIESVDPKLANDINSGVFFKEEQSRNSPMDRLIDPSLDEKTRCEILSLVMENLYAKKHSKESFKSLLDDIEINYGCPARETFERICDFQMQATTQEYIARRWMIGTANY